MIALLELLAERAAGAEDERLDGADREAEDLGDLLVGAALELAHDERGTLVEGEVAERAAEVLGAAASSSSLDRLGERLVELDLVRAALRWRKRWRQTLCAIAISQFCGRARALAALVGAVGVHEGRLRDVLCIGRVAQGRPARSGRRPARAVWWRRSNARSRALARQDRRHDLNDAGNRRFLRHADG